MSKLIETLTAAQKALEDGNFFYNAGQFARAKQSYDRAHLLGTSSKTDYSLALVHGSMGQVPKSIEFYETALRLDPFFVEARVNYGSVLRDRANFDAARKQHTIAYGLAPGHPIAEFNLGLTYARRRNFPIARRLIEAALARTPDLKLAVQALAKLPPVPAPHPEWNLTDQGALGEIGAGRDDAAITRLEPFLARYPGSALAWTDYGAALIRLGRAAEAIPALERSRDIKPDQAPAYHNLGSACMMVGDDAKACENYFLAIACDPSLVESWLSLSHLFRLRGANVDAWEILLPSAQTNPPNVKLLIAFAECSRRVQRMDMALQAIKNVESVLPDSFVVHNNSGTFHLENGSLAEATASFEKAAEIEPGSAMVAGNLGASYEIAQRYDEALAQYERASTLDPDNLGFVTRRMHVAQHLCA